MAYTFRARDAVPKKDGDDEKKNQNPQGAASQTQRSGAPSQRTTVGASSTTRPGSSAFRASRMVNRSIPEEPSDFDVEEVDESAYQPASSFARSAYTGYRGVAATHVTAPAPPPPSVEEQPDQEFQPSQFQGYIPTGTQYQPSQARSQYQASQSQYQASRSQYQASQSQYQASRSQYQPSQSRSQYQPSQSRPTTGKSIIIRPGEPHHFGTSTDPENARLVCTLCRCRTPMVHGDAYTMLNSPRGLSIDGKPIDWQTAKARMLDYYGAEQISHEEEVLAIPHVFDEDTAKMMMAAEEELRGAILEGRGVNVNTDGNTVNWHGNGSVRDV